jgi:flagellar hook protein FlgE
MNLTTFTTALSGMNANAQGLSVVGNNLANLNTVGFKSSNISFVDVLGEAFATGSAGSGNVNLGLGTQVGSVRANFMAGSVQTTNNPLDVAIQGKGMLVLNGAEGKFYSRAGNLHLEINNLVADNGMAVQGYVRNPNTGQVDSNLGLQNIHLPSGLESPVKTSEVELTMNLNANAADATQFSTSFQVYDSIGTAHMAKLTLEKEGTTGTPPLTKWKFDVTIPEKEVAGADPLSTNSYSLITGDVPTASSPTAGTLVFDGSGKLTSAYMGTDPGTLPALDNITFPPSGVTMPTMAGGGALSSSLAWKLVSADGTSPVTAFASPSDVTFSGQNGAAAGKLNNMTVLSDGTISAVFTNGKTVNFAQIVLAQFGNIDGLEPAGGGLYRESVASGSSFVGTPGDGGRGRLIGGALEQSNVDLATELTKIITFQRGYQANAKLITTTDQIIQQTIQMVQ